MVELRAGALVKRLSTFLMVVVGQVDTRTGGISNVETSSGKRHEGREIIGKRVVETVVSCSEYITQYTQI